MRFFYVALYGTYCIFQCFQVNNWKWTSLGSGSFWLLPGSAAGLKQGSSPLPAGVMDTLRNQELLRSVLFWFLAQHPQKWLERKAVLQNAQSPCSSPSRLDMSKTGFFRSETLPTMAYKVWVQVHALQHCLGACPLHNRWESWLWVLLPPWVGAMSGGPVSRWASVPSSGHCCYFFCWEIRGKKQVCTYKYNSCGKSLWMHYKVRIMPCWPLFQTYFSPKRKLVLPMGLLQ